MYSKLDLFAIRDLNSKYSVALYELIKDYQNIGGITITVENFRKLMGIDQGKYRYFTMLEQKVIQKAVTEINQKTDIHITFQSIKE